MTPYIIDRNFTNKDLAVINNVRSFANIKHDKWKRTETIQQIMSG